MAAALVVGLLAAPATAQTTMEAWGSGLVLNFSTPGARSLGLGGAFLGLSDDATAAYANPAGLTLLPDLEVSVEARFWQFEHIYTDRGVLGRAPTGLGVDTISGLRDGRDSDDVAGLSFVSVVKPFKKGAVALYGHTLANFEANYQTQGAFVSTFRAFPTRNRLDLEIRSVGLSAAYRLRDGLSIGLGLTRYDFQIDNRTDRFCVFNPDSTFSSCSLSLIGPPDLSRLTNFQTETGSGSDLGATAGFLLTVNQQWRIGGVLRQGPEFEYLGEFFLPDGRLSYDQPATFKVPHQYGLGVAFRPSDRLSFAFDYYWIVYSRFTDGLADLQGSPKESFEDVPAEMNVQDAAEVHLGAEYFFLRARRPLFIRAGIWSDPDHGLAYRGFRPYYDAIFRARGRVTHFAIGAGVSGRRHQLDVALDYSGRGATASLSTVVRF